MPGTRIKIALVDDHVLLRNALAALIAGFEGCAVLHESGSGDELLEYMVHGAVPDVVLLDLNMPGLNGYETAKALQERYPQVHVLMLTMYDSELMLIRLLQAGVKGFLKKDVHPSELKFALHAVVEAGYYYSTNTAGKLANLFRQQPKEPNRLQQAMLTEQEVDFFKVGLHRYDV